MSRVMALLSTGIHNKGARKLSRYYTPFFTQITFSFTEFERKWYPFHILTVETPSSTLLSKCATKIKLLTKGHEERQREVENGDRFIGTFGRPF